MSLSLRDWPLAWKRGLWLAWLLLLGTAFAFLYVGAINRQPETMEEAFFLLAWTVSGTGLWVLWRLDKRDTVMASVAAGLVASIVAGPALILVIYLVAFVGHMVAP